MEDVNVAKAEALLQQAGDRLRAEESITKMVSSHSLVIPRSYNLSFIPEEGIIKG